MKNSFWIKRDKTCVDVRATDFLKLDGQLGGGAYGQVFKYKHKPSGEVVAGKGFELTAAWDDIRTDQHIQRERTFLSEIQGSDPCQNIVFYRGYVPLRKKLFIYMELMDCSFKDLLDSGHRSNWEFPEVACWAFLKQTANGLRYIHEKRYMHRDIKPSNILFSVEDGSVKLADFGTTKKYKGEVETGRTLHSRNPGTHCYSAPEVLIVDRCSDNYDARYSTSCDIWSLAITLIEIKMRAHPIDQGYEFTHSRDTSSRHWLLEQLTENIQNFQIITNSELGHVSEDLYQLCTACLYKVIPPRHEAEPLSEVHRPTAAEICKQAGSELEERGLEEKGVLRQWFVDSGLTIPVRGTNDRAR